MFAHLLCPATLIPSDLVQNVDFKPMLTHIPHEGADGTGSGDSGAHQNAVGLQGALMRYPSPFF